MTTETKDLLALADTLENFNKWRHGEEDSDQPHPAGIGIALDKAIAIIRASATSAPDTERLDWYVKQRGQILSLGEDWYWCSAYGQPRYKAKSFRAAIDSARAKPATPQPAESCKWLESDPWGEMPNTYESNCGEAWSFIEGGPVENSVKFCHGCGKPVIVEPFAPQPAEGDK